MSIMLKIVLGIGVILLGLGSTCVTIAALFQPMEYKGDGKVPKDDAWDESI